MIPDFHCPFPRPFGIARGALSPSEEVSSGTFDY